MTSQLLKALGFIILAYSLITLPVIVFGEDCYPKIGALQKQLERLDHDNQKLRWGIREVKKQISDLRSDPGLIKRVAHQDFGYISSDEVMFIVD
jgi:cell division protein FtsB